MTCQREGEASNKIRKRIKAPLAWLGVCAAVILVLILNVHTPLSLFIWNHLKSNESSALASWFSALATIVLVFGLFFTKQSMKESAQSSTFQRIYEQFNAPNMLHSRAVLAKTHWKRVENGGFDRVKDNSVPILGWPVVNFLNNVGYLVHTGQLDFDDVVFAYGYHVQLISERWKHILTLECWENRYKPLFDLRAKIDTSPQRAVRNDMDRSWEHAHKAFWKCEAALDTNARGEDDSPPSP
ncbi:MAG: hypothetical protein ACREHD_29160, partial [Pirellulales bacterium]